LVVEDGLEKEHGSWPLDDTLEKGGSITSPWMHWIHEV